MLPVDGRTWSSRRFTLQHNVVARSHSLTWSSSHWYLVVEEQLLLRDRRVSHRARLVTEQRCSSQPYRQHLHHSHCLSVCLSLRTTCRRLMDVGCSMCAVTSRGASSSSSRRTGRAAGSDMMGRRRTSGLLAAASHTSSLRDYLISLTHHWLAH